MGIYSLTEQVVKNKIEFALKNKNFEVFYQPFFDINSKKIIGCEALLRLKGGEGDTISPATLIPIAEKTNLISEIDYLVFEAICRNLNQDKINKMPMVPVSVNFSRISFIAEGFIAFIEKTVDFYEIDPSLLILEITETSMMCDYQTLTNNICYLRSLGFKVAIDDFGTGYSSLSALSQLDVDIIKIDKSFIDNLELKSKNYYILKCIIDLASILGLNIICEGVETREQLKSLETLKIKIVQGFLFEKPLNKKSFNQILLTNCLV